jgi:hypothetical protein
MAQTQEPVVIAVDDSMRAQEMLMTAGRPAKDDKLKTTDLTLAES